MMNRQNIIETWDVLEHTLSDYERGRATLDEVKVAYQEYVVACMTIKEPAFWLNDIVAYVPEIPHGYPETGPADIPAPRGTYQTPTYTADRERRRAILRGKE